MGKVRAKKRNVALAQTLLVSIHAGLSLVDQTTGLSFQMQLF